MLVLLVSVLAFAGQQECRGIEDDGVRLACYDAAFREGATILEQRGNGAVNTRPFSTDGPWEVQWDADSDLFQIYVMTGDGNMLGVAANQQGQGTGASYQPRAGRFYLQVNAIGTWTVKVVEVDP